MKQREIKFRAWDKKYRKMWYFGFENVDGGIIGPAYDIPLSECDVMQFTGLTDKNGVEIYESDRIKITQYNQDGKENASAENYIVWNDGEARFEFGETMNGLGGIGGHDLAVFLYRTGNKPGLMDWYLEWEVIGNLYEQPNKK